MALGLPRLRRIGLATYPRSITAWSSSLALSRTLRLVADTENGGDGVEQAAQGNADRQRAGEETEAGSLDDAPTRTAALPVSASGREGVTRLRSGSP